ncbi:MAG: hypothetical protein ACOC42_01540 [Halobacteriota archaeon]
MSTIVRRFVPTRAALRQSPTAIRRALSHGDTWAVVALVTGTYLALFLWAIGDLFVQPTGSVGIDVVDDPLAVAVTSGPGPYTYEAIARLEAGVFLLLVSPLNVAIGLGLASLVGLNIGLVYEAYKRPASCGLEAGSAAFASIPALLTGSACCAPAAFIAFGITATGTLLTAFSLLLPLGVVLLLASLVYVGSHLVAEPV